MLQRPALLIAPLLASFGLVALTAPAAAVTLPAIEATPKNAVPACVTPGRLMAYLKDNNPRLRSKFNGVATEYMRHGEKLALRWDYAFFQMLVETGFLKYTGDVKWHQNNFAGLGATGGGVRGESFDSVADGVRAHLEHLSMYTGKYISNPTAERTRKIQEWKILTKWQRQFKTRPMTFKDMAAKWAPGSHGYPRDIEFVGERFFAKNCKQPDPQPELVLAARGGKSGTTKSKPTEAAKRQANVAVKTKTTSTSALPNGPRSGLGAGTKAAASTAQVKVLNKDNEDNKADDAAAKNDKEFKTAMLSDAADKANPSANSNSGGATATSKATCRVWSASYGGTKAVIIKAVDNQIVNYTVLKVNDGRAKPEANAYIHAYAKGGALIDEFPNPDQALKKAFELCPEG